MNKKCREEKKESKKKENKEHSPKGFSFLPLL